jgi:uncharacterized protein YbcI
LDDQSISSTSHDGRAASRDGRSASADGHSVSEARDRGQLAAQISREIVRLHARLYGRGPTKARTYLQSDYALCILEDVFTTAERTLARAGNGAQVTATRAAFQDTVSDQFIALVEEITGRKVRALTSQIDIPEELAVELFIFAREPQEPASAGDGDGRVDPRSGLDA